MLRSFKRGSLTLSKLLPSTSSSTASLSRQYSVSTVLLLSRIPRGSSYTSNATRGLSSRLTPVRALHSRPARYASSVEQTERLGPQEDYSVAEDYHEEEGLVGQQDQQYTQAAAGGGHAYITKFKELAEQKLVSETVVSTLTQSMKLETMTPVQSQTINETLKGTDVYVELLSLGYHCHRCRAA